MRDLAQTWEEHQQALIRRRDLRAALAPLAADPVITHIPAMTGATGRQAVERFYADQFLPHLPADLTLRRISRTVDRWRLVDETTVSFHHDPGMAWVVRGGGLVDETTVSFTHDREMPWLLPGVEPTFRQAEVLAIAVVGFDRTRIRSQRVLWDHATLAVQLTIIAPASTGLAR